MSEEREPVKKNLFESIMEIDLSKQRMNAAPNPTAAALAESIRESQLGFTLGQLAKSQQLANEEAEINLGERKKELEEKRKKLQGESSETKEDKDSPLSKFMEGFKDPQILMAWNGMNQDARQGIMSSLMQMQMMYNMGKGKDSSMGMMPMMMMMQGMGNKSSNDLTSRDLAVMFSEGVKVAKEAAPTPVTPPNPVDTLNSTLNVIKPLYDQQSEVQKALVQAQMDAIRQASSQTKGLKESVGDIKDILDVFGGGGDRNSATDIELARINADNQFRIQQMNMEMRRMEREMDANSARTDAFSGIAQTIAASAVPKLLGGLDMHEMGRQQAMAGMGQAGPKPSSSPGSAPGR